jgi:hypothetical protein
MWLRSVTALCVDGYDLGALAINVTKPFCYPENDFFVKYPG